MAVNLALVCNVPMAGIADITTRKSLGRSEANEHSVTAHSTDGISRA